MSTLYPDLTSSFPDSVDSFPTWLNIVAADGPLIQQYQSALQAGNTTLANQILAQIPQGTQKIIKASDLNLITSAMLAVERFYKDNIADYVSDKQESWLNTINQFSYKGSWSSGTAYLQNNIVLYTTSGLQLLFLATATPPLGTPPTNTSYWRVLTIQGQQGTSGPGLTYMQEWNASTTYNTNDAVTYSGGLWMALQSSTNVQPGTNEEFWKLVIPIITTTYPIQSTQPLTQVQGDLWFNTQDNPTQYYYLEQLENPADASKLWLNYEAYDDQGNLITGEFETYTKEEIDTEKAAIIENGVVSAGETVTAGQVVDVILTYGSNTLGGQTEGNIVKLNENGQPVEFYVAQQNYEVGLNGYGRTLLVRKDVYQNGQWNASGVNTYAGSTIDNWFNGTYKATLDSWAQNAIGTIKFYYTPGNGDTNVTTLEKHVFPLSANELGTSGGLFNAEGSTVPIANLLRQNNGTQWTRTPYKSITTQSIYFDVDGGIEYGNCNSSYGYRPCFTLPANLTVLPDGTVTSTPSPTPPTYTITTSGTPSTAIALESGSAGDTIPIIFNGTTSAPFIARDQIIQGTDGGVFGYGILDGILGVTAKQVGKGTGSVKIATGSYVGTGTYGVDNPNTLTFGFEPKLVFIQSDAIGLQVDFFVLINGADRCVGLTCVGDSSFSVLGYSNMVSSFGSNYVSYYTSLSAKTQANVADEKYHYIAFG